MQCESAAAPTGECRIIAMEKIANPKQIAKILKRQYFLSSPTQCFFISVLQIRGGKCYICSLDNLMVSVQAKLFYCGFVRSRMSHREGFHVHMMKTNAEHRWASSCRTNITSGCCFKQSPWGTPKPCAKKVLLFRPGILALQFNRNGLKCYCLDSTIFWQFSKPHSWSHNHMPTCNFL